MVMENSFCEKPERCDSRRLSDHLKLDGKRKVHSLVDKVYQRRNLGLAWERVKANRGSGGIDGVTIEAFESASWGTSREALSTPASTTS